MESTIEELSSEVIRAKEDLYGYSFRWIKGENKGNITDLQDVIFDPAMNITWIYFTDGTRINYNILDEFMMRIDADEVNEINMAKEMEKNASVTKPSRNIQLSESNASNNRPDNSPIRTLLQKQKPNWIDVSFNLRLNLPPKSLYDVLDSSFDNAEDEIINFVVDDLDIEIIREALRKNIRDIYKKHGE